MRHARRSASEGEHCGQPFAFRKQPESFSLLPTFSSSPSWSRPVQFAFQQCSVSRADYLITPTVPSNINMLTHAIIASDISEWRAQLTPPRQSRDSQWCSSERFGLEWERERAANGCSQQHEKNVGNERLRVGACWPPQVAGLCFSSHGWSPLRVRLLV